MQCRIRGRKGGFEYESRTEMLSDEKRPKDVGRFKWGDRGCWING
jgi:hypothetical protein